LEALRIGSSTAVPSLSLESSANTPGRPRRPPPPPPVPAKSSSVSSKYPASSNKVQERERTQSSPNVIVHAPEDTSASPSIPTYGTHSRASSVGSLGMLSTNSNPTTNSTSTPRSSLSNENPFRRLISRLNRPGDDERDQEHQADASPRRSRLSLSPSSWGRKSSSGEPSAQLL
jgi:hypothetical protein